MKKHKGNGTGNAEQGTGRRRGPETGNGRTASTGHGKVDRITYQGTVPGQKSRLRTIADVITGRHRKR